LLGELSAEATAVAAGPLGLEPLGEVGSPDGGIGWIISCRGMKKDVELRFL
jgi:hypothetical protein